MFMRNKPGHGWIVDEGLPDFTKVKKDQSFNWSSLSIPIWTRFNDKKIYLDNYAVVGVKVKTIRFPNKYDSSFKPFSWDVHHNPFDTNYSHCELNPKDLSKTEIRGLRMTLRHKSKIYFLPNEEMSPFKFFKHYLTLKFHYLTTRF